MPVIDKTAIIARLIGEIFDFLAITRNLSRWDSSMLECVQVGIVAVPAPGRGLGPGGRAADPLTR
jgi:hypothetical protein